MTFEYVIDEALGKLRVGSGAARRFAGELSVAKDDVINHRQGRHQLGSSALGQQRPGGIRDFDHHQTARLTRPPQEPNMFREQRIEVAGYPPGGTILQPLLDFVERDDFRSSVQKQSLTVMCRFGAWHAWMMAFN
jgi:hypothetical protein